MRRKYGTISVRGGRYQARVRVDGRLVTIGTFDRRETADAALAEFSALKATDAPLAGHTLRSWAERWLSARELDGVHRSVDRDRHAAKRFLLAEFSALPMQAITARDVRAWCADQLATKTRRKTRTGHEYGEPARPARQTVQNSLNLLRVCLDAAVDAGHIEANPARGAKVPRVASTKERWTWLTQAELDRLLGSDALPAETRDLLAFSVYAGLRAGEVFGLQWSDVDLRTGSVTVRHSWGGDPTKRGEARVVRVLAPAAEALRRQHARSSMRRHVWPDSAGQGRKRSQSPRLSELLELAGIRRHARLHDLRHTCASHLISGTWGPAWPIERVAQYLGHSSSAVTRRYAHLCPDGLAQLVVATHGPRTTGSSHESTSASGASANAHRKYAESAEEKGFEPLVALPPRRFSKRASSSKIPPGWPKMRTSRERLAALLAGLRDGSTTAAQVAEVAVDVLAEPHPLVSAAHRMLAALGSPAEGRAAVDLLSMVTEWADSDDAHAGDGTGRCP